MSVCLMFFFFFSSRRRHTRFDCDWSSDVCSSDLVQRSFTSASDVNRIERTVVWQNESKFYGKTLPCESGHGRFPVRLPQEPLFCSVSNGPLQSEIGQFAAAFESNRSRS